MTTNASSKKVLVLTGIGSLLGSLMVLGAAVGISLTSISVTPGGPDLQVGQTRQFTATGAFSDSSSRVLVPGGGWSDDTPLPAARYPFGGAMEALGGKLYAVGGGDSTSPFYNTMFAFDPATHTWSTLPPMPTARQGHCVAAIGGKLYVIGGLQPGFSASNVVECYDPGTGVWTTRAPMPTPRQWASAAVVDGIIYVVGGDGYGPVLDTVEAYDPAADSWSSKAARPLAVKNQMLGVIGSRIYAAGGSFNSGISTAVHEYTPATNTWVAKHAMSLDRCVAASAVLNNRLYIIGGASGDSSTPTSEIYDPATDTWSPGPSMPTLRFNYGSALLDGAVYLAGGYDYATGSYVARVEAFRLGDGLVWSSSDVSVATVTPAGLATAVGPGTAQITASSGGVTGGASLTVALTPQQQIQEIAGNVLDLVSDGDINAGQGNALRTKLTNAIAQLNPGGSVATARDILGAFINQVQSLVNGHKLTAEQGQILISAANAVLVQLGS